MTMTRARMSMSAPKLMAMSSSSLAGLRLWSVRMRQRSLLNGDGQLQTTRGKACECIPKVNMNRHVRIETKQWFTETYSGYTGNQQVRFKPALISVFRCVCGRVRQITLLTCRKVHQCPGGICTVLHFYSNLHVCLHRVWTSAGPEVPPDRLQTENMEAPWIILKVMDAIFICGEWHRLVPNAAFKCSRQLPLLTNLHGDAHLTEDTHCCWTMWSERSLMEAESLWSGGCQPAPPWSEAAQPVLRGGLQHREEEHRKYEFRRWDFTPRMLDFFSPLLVQNSGFLHIKTPHFTNITIKKEFKNLKAVSKKVIYSCPDVSAFVWASSVDVIPDVLSTSCDDAEWSARQSLYTRSRPILAAKPRNEGVL